MYSETLIFVNFAKPSTSKGASDLSFWRGFDVFKATLLEQRMIVNYKYCSLMYSEISLQQHMIMSYGKRTIEAWFPKVV